MGAADGRGGGGGGVWGRRRKHNNGPHYLCWEQEAEQWLRDGGGPSHPWGEVNTPPPTPWPLPSPPLARTPTPPPPDSPALSRRGAGPVFRAASRPADGCGRKRASFPAEFLPLPPFVCANNGNAEGVRHSRHSRTAPPGAFPAFLPVLQLVVRLLQPSMHSRSPWWSHT